jgi:hypothetical protein
LLVHLAGAHWPDEPRAVPLAKGEGHEQRPAGSDATNGDEPVLRHRMIDTGRHPWPAGKQHFDLANEGAMLLSLG